MYYFLPLLVHLPCHAWTRSPVEYLPFLLMFHFLILGASQVALVVKNLFANTGDVRDAGSIPGLGRSPGEAHGNPLQYSCLENSTDRGVWWATVHRVAKTEATCTHAQQLKSDLVYSL